MLHANYHYFSFYLHVTILVHVIEASVSGDSQSKKISSPAGGKIRSPAGPVTPSKKFYASSVHKPHPRSHSIRAVLVISKDRGKNSK